VTVLQAQLPVDQAAVIVAQAGVAVAMQALTNAQTVVNNDNNSITANLAMIQQLQMMKTMNGC